MILASPSRPRDQDHLVVLIIDVGGQENHAAFVAVGLGEAQGFAIEPGHYFQIVYEYSNVT